MNDTPPPPTNAEPKRSGFSLALVPEKAIDPVCGMTVDPATAPASTTHQGKPYSFCCPHCLLKFQADPDRYTGVAPPPAAPMVPPPPSPGEKVEYVCPMGPEVVSDRPGPCPKCGMALEPRTLALQDGPSPELADVSRRFLVGLALSLPVFLLAMADMLPRNPLHALDRGLVNWAQLLLATPVVLWSGARSSSVPGPRPSTAAPTCSP